MRLILVALMLIIGTVQSSAQTVSGDRFRLNTGPCTIRSGSGSPEGAVTGVVCDTYHQTNSPYDVWRKTSGSGNTGWVKDTGIVAAALTKTDDTNVTATLGGSPSVALLAATSITLGWTGQLSVPRGGIGQASVTAGQILYGAGTSPLASSANLTFNGSSLSIAGGSSNYIAWTAGGVAAPSFSTSSAGSKIILYPQVGGSSVDYAIGINSNTQWFSVPQTTSHYFDWYGGTTLAMRLSTPGTLSIKNDILPFTNNVSNIGNPANKFLTLSVSELLAQTIVAQDVMATIGGVIIVAPTTLFVADLAPAGTTITVKHNQFANGDRLYLQASPGGVPQVEYMAVTSSAGGVAGAYTYTVTRNLDGTGANQWYTGDAIVNTGTTGDGLIDIFSTAGGSGPTLLGEVRTGTGYADFDNRFAIGNLNGFFGYASDTYGAAFGSASGAWLKIDPTNGVRIGHNSTTYTQIDASGNASFTGAITAATGTIGGWSIASTSLTATSATVGLSSAVSGGDDVRFFAGHASPPSAPFRVTEAGALVASNATITGAITATSGTVTGAFTIGTSGSFSSGASAYGTGTGYWMDYNSGTPRFRVGTVSGNRIDWDGTNLTIRSSNVSMGTGGVQIISPPSSVSVSGQYGFTPGIWGGLRYGLNAVEVSAGLFDRYLSVENIIDGGTAGYSGTANNIHAEIAQFVYNNSGGQSARTQLVAYHSGEADFALGSRYTITANYTVHTANVYTGGDTGLGGNISIAGVITPTGDGNGTVGSGALRFSLIRGITITAGDLGFENDWALTESYKVGIAEPGIAMLDENGELVAFFGKSGFKAKGLTGSLDIDSVAHAKTTSAERAKMDRNPERRVKGVKKDPSCSKKDADPVLCASGELIYKTSADVDAVPNPNDRVKVKSTTERKGQK